MKLGRFFLIVIYMGYLVNVGLMLVLLPWSAAWGRLLTSFPPVAAATLDSPFVRGSLSAFGVLHLMLVVWELIDPSLLNVPNKKITESQDVNQS